MMKTYQNHAMTDAEARQALADACKQVETNLPLYTYRCGHRGRAAHRRSRDVQ